MLLKLLEDKNGEVQNLAVRCLGPLVGKVKDYQVESIVDTLCNNMVGRNEQLRDISSIGLKTVINELPLTTQSLAASVCKTMVGRLTRAIAQDECQDVSVQLEALDILGDLLSRFGGLLIQFHPSLQEALTPQLKSPRLAVRKRSVIALGHLVMSCDQALYTKLINLLLTELEGSTSTLNKRTYIQAVGAICRQAGHRFGDHVERVVPLVLEYAKEDDDELREHCLQDCENMIYKCGKEITPHIPIIMKLCLEYICYDPNYNYDETDDDENMECDEDDDDVGDDSEDEYSDDDDMSWKVRRAAAKCLEAIISTRHELLETFYLTVSPALVSRFKEREENVKADIFHAYIALLKQTKPSIIPLVNDSNSMEQEEGPVARLQAQVPNIVKVIHRQMKEKSIKTRQGCFNLLTELILVLPGALTPHIPALIPGIQFSLGDKQSSSNMKIDTVAFIQHLLTHHPPIVFHSHVAALLVLESLVKVIRPLKEESNFDFKCYTSPIYHCCFVKLKASDIDQEVKERAISCMGQILAHLGDHLRNELPSCLPIFAERLNNEITRLTAVKALTKIANSPLRIDISPILSNSLPTLASFLRKNQRALKLSALTLLDTVVRNYSTSINATNLSTVLVELHPLLTESDLHIAQLTLHFLTSVAKLQKDSLPSIYDTSLMEIFKLAQSPLLQGAALVAMLDFLKALVAADLPGLGERDLLMKLILPVMKPSGSSIHKQGRASIAKCVAALVVTNPETAQTVVKDFSENLKEQSDNYHKQTFSLLAIGEIGNYIDLSKNAELKNIVLKSFNHSSEEVKSAASYALGKLSLGNLKEYLPFVLQEIESQPKRQYLLLHSLKEIISVQSTSSDGVQILAPYVPAIWDQLFKHCECNEEGLKSALDSPSPLMRTTVVTAMKFTISDQPQPIDNLLRNNIGDFLRCLEDSDLNVRRVALVAFNSAAHNKPSLIRGLWKWVPFKHEVDDGLDLRKAAFECMYTLLDNCVDRLDIFEFLSHVQDGLKDHYDIKMLTYLMVARVAEFESKFGQTRVYEKQDDLKRSAMRAVAALMGIPGANKHPILNEFITQIRNTPDLANLFDSIQKDNSGERHGAAAAGFSLKRKARRKKLNSVISLIYNNGSPVKFVYYFL
ncbi:CAND1 [Lepeophtheirus salmonis]|uniref:CAND1 n=1 Tax=Lepeophtheirus salmonis TaxID=72036 RepID=A0A7R8H9C6_LEPSM|nr:CAND1 [Lepeophtheirus salmonis]CAF2947054.1 CAND1 [Lepeophtheirus salmonis]